MFDRRGLEGRRWVCHAVAVNKDKRSAGDIAAVTAC
jgi:hypothetical protein